MWQCPICTTRCARAGLSPAHAPSKRSPRPLRARPTSLRRAAPAPFRSPRPRTAAERRGRCQRRTRAVVAAATQAGRQRRKRATVAALRRGRAARVQAAPTQGQAGASRVTTVSGRCSMVGGTRREGQRHRGQCHASRCARPPTSDSGGRLYGRLRSRPALAQVQQRSGGGGEVEAMPVGRHMHVTSLRLSSGAVWVVVGSRWDSRGTQIPPVAPSRNSINKNSRRGFCVSPGGY